MRTQQSQVGLPWSLRLILILFIASPICLFLILYFFLELQQRTHCFNQLIFLFYFYSIFLSNSVHFLRQSGCQLFIEIIPQVMMLSSPQLIQFGQVIVVFFISIQLFSHCLYFRYFNVHTITSISLFRQLLLQSFILLGQSLIIRHALPHQLDVSVVVLVMDLQIFETILEDSELNQLIFLLPYSVLGFQIFAIQRRESLLQFHQSIRNQLVLVRQHPLLVFQHCNLIFQQSYFILHIVIDVGQSLIFRSQQHRVRYLIITPPINSACQVLVVF